MFVASKSNLGVPNPHQLYKKDLHDQDNHDGVIILTCLLRNLYAGQEATVRAGHGTTDWFEIGKGICQGCILSSCLFNLYAEYIMRNAVLEETQAGIKILGMQPEALPFPRKELSPREALAVCTPPAPKPSARTPGS